MDIDVCYLFHFCIWLLSSHCHGLSFIINKKHLSKHLLNANWFFYCMSQFSYIGLMLVFAIIPSLILLYLLRDKINFKNLGISLLILFILGVIWDQISVRFGIWSFSRDKIMGNFFGIPIEEYIFIIFVPLLAITVYMLINKIFKK